MRKKQILEKKMQKLLIQLRRAVENSSSLDILESLQEQIKEVNKSLWELT